MMNKIGMSQKPPCNIHLLCTLWLTQASLYLWQKSAKLGIDYDSDFIHGMVIMPRWVEPQGIR